MGRILGIVDKWSKAVQAIGSVAIVMEHHASSKAVQNVHTEQEKLLVAFTNMWNEDRTPSVVDKLERSFTELQRVVRAYLLDKWGLWHSASQPALSTY